MSYICHCFGPLDYDAWARAKLSKIIMESDELQSLQLKDGEWMTMIQWAQSMGISKSVFAETYKKARWKLIDVIVNTRILLIKCPEDSL